MLQHFVTAPYSPVVISLTHHSLIHSCTNHSLEQRVSTLDPAGFEIVRSKAAVLKAELEALQGPRGGGGKATQLTAEGAMGKLQELHTDMRRVRGVVDDLPAVALRLKTLEAVHVSSAGLVARLEGLEATSEGLKADVFANGETLRTLKEVP